MIISITDSLYCCCFAFLMPNWTIKVISYLIHQLHRHGDLWQLLISNLFTFVTVSSSFLSSSPSLQSFHLLYCIYAKSLFSGISHSLVLTISAFPLLPWPYILHSMTMYSLTLPSLSSASHINCCDLYLLSSYIYKHTQIYDKTAKPLALISAPSITFIHSCVSFSHPHMLPFTFPSTFFLSIPGKLSVYTEKTMALSQFRSLQKGHIYKSYKTTFSLQQPVPTINIHCLYPSCCPSALLLILDYVNLFPLPLTGSCFKLQCKIFRVETVLVQQLVQWVLVEANKYFFPTKGKDRDCPRLSRTYRAIQFPFLIHSKVESAVNSSNADQAHCYTDKFQYTYKKQGKKTNNVDIVSIERFFYMYVTDPWATDSCF